MRTKWRLPITHLSVILVAGLLLAACSAVAQEDSGASANASGVDSTVHAADFDILLYNKTALLGEDDETSFSRLLSLDRPIVLNMWAGLCPPCRVEMPDFQQVSDEFGDQILLFGLDVGAFANLGTSQDGRALVEELAITYPTGTTTDPAVVQDYQVLGLPTTYFITADGVIHRRWTGPLTADKLGELVQELLEVNPTNT